MKNTQLIFKAFSIWLLTTFFLTGCQTTIVNTPNVYNPLNSQKGYIIATLIDAGGNPLGLNQITFTGVDEQNEKFDNPQRIESLEQHKMMTLFFGEVSPGQFTLSNLRAFWFINNSEFFHSYSKFVSANLDLNSFKVEPGKVTDLGTLVYFTYKDGAQWKEGIIPFGASNKRIYDHYIPNYDSLGTPLTPWNDNTLSEHEFNSLRTFVKKKQWRFKSFFNSQDEDLLVGLNLGMIARRSKNNKWELIELDTNFPITALALGKNGSIAAGANHGEIFIKHQSRDWQKAFLPVTYIEPVQLSFISDQTLEAIVTNETQISIYRLNLSSTKMQWRKAYSFTPYSSWLDAKGKKLKVEGESFERGWNIQHAEVNTLTNKLYIQPISRRSRVLTKFYFEFDISQIDQGLVTARELPSYSEPPRKAGTRLFVKKWSGFTKAREDYHFDPATTDIVNISDSYDNCPSDSDCSGETSQRKRFIEYVFNSNPIFINDKQALLIVSPENNKNSLVTIITSDGGKSWRRLRTPPPGRKCMQINTSGSQRVSVICDDSLYIHTTNDLGKTWEKQYIGVDKLSKQI